ncbi:MAG: family 1 extracellular solute-binding protein [Paenibacillaceae bacterium]|jgi:putative aldouronate transport system substrate-binding protein|nr:family 1 extracellular solute-binding protein [Paenibacillaceae bacterium]
MMNKFWRGRIKWRLAAVALLAAALALAAGCREEEASLDAVQPPESSAAASEPEAYSRSAKPVGIRIGFKIPDSHLMAGDSNDNNPVTRYLESITNIRISHYWEAKGEEAYSQRVRMAVDSRDLPDAMVVDREQLERLINGGMVEDLTEVFNRYGSSLVKNMYRSTGNQVLEDASRGGRLYGLPNVALQADSATLLWVREDWLGRLNLSPPETLDDIERIARAFVERDPDGNGKRDTVGISGYRNIVYGQKPHINGFDSVFNAFGAYPGNWVRDSRGEIIYGSVAPEAKQALARLADWYKRGLIDPDFPLYQETQEPIVASKAGIFFGPWWMPYFPLSDAVRTNINAEWRAYAAPLDAEGRFIIHSAPATDRFLVVRKGYEHPEAVVKLVNAFTRLERRQDPNEAAKTLDDFSAKTGIQPRAYYPFDLLIDYADAIETHYADLLQALHGKIDPGKLEPEARLLYDKWNLESAQPKKDLEGWKAVNAYKYGVGVLASTPSVRVRSVFYGVTASMPGKWSELQRMENEAFLKIIVGDSSLEEFDRFVKEWEISGGAQITEEVQQAVPVDMVGKLR